MDFNRRLKAIKIKLMRSEEFGLLGGVAMHGNTIITTEIPIAATNGRDCYYNPEFLAKQIGNGDRGVGFIMVHEWMHKAAMHLVVYKNLYKKNAKLAGYATDYWINDKLVMADPTGRLIQMPTDINGNKIGLHDPKYRNWTVTRILKALEEEASDEDEDQNGQGEAGKGFDEHKWEEAAAIGTEEVAALGEEITQAIRQGIHAGQKAGAGALGDSLGLGELVTPKIDWRVQLRSFMNSTCRKKTHSSWRRPNRRFLHLDMILPSLESKGIKEIVLARDASGSMYMDNRLNKVTSEMVNLVGQLNVDKIHVIDWDGAVGNHDIYTSATLAKAPKVRTVIGGGGTSPSCVPEYLAANKIKPDCVVMLTDGEVSNWGKWTVPVLWAIVNNVKITAPIGRTVNIT
tara:strand:- start:3894 stop:5096 length:1203 start_codon:yes stop_codon:yes gene_type:complete